MDDGDILRALRKAAASRQGQVVMQGPVVQQRVKSYTQNLLASRSATQEPTDRQVVAWLKTRRRVHLGRAFERWTAQSPLSRAIIENEALAAQVARLERQLRDQRQLADEPSLAEQALYSGSCCSTNCSLQKRMEQYAQRLDSRVQSVSDLFASAPPGALVCAVLENPSKLASTVSAWRANTMTARSTRQLTELDSMWNARAANAQGLESHVLTGQIHEIEAELSLRSRQVGSRLHIKWRSKIDLFRRSLHRSKELCMASVGSISQAWEHYNQAREGCRQMGIELAATQ